LGIFNRTEQVQTLGFCSTHFECVSRFDVTVGSGCSQHTDTRDAHEIPATGAISPSTDKPLN
jgi:hypothetical protein